jgi:2'-5' RNA ligase
MKSSPATAPAARISYWLLPEPTVRASLQHVIDELAAAYAGPAFVPHMTVAVSAQAAPDAVRQRLTQGAATIAPLLLSPVELQFSPAFTQSCFVHFKREAELMQLAHGFHRREASTATYSFNPHMSLFYGALSAAQRQRILQRVALPQVIQFSELWAIRILNKTASAQDVHDWRVVGKTKLRAAATPPADQNAQTPRER